MSGIINWQPGTGQLWTEGQGWWNALLRKVGKWMWRRLGWKSMRNLGWTKLTTYSAKIENFKWQ